MEWSELCRARRAANKEEAGEGKLTKPYKGGAFGWRAISQVARRIALRLASSAVPRLELYISVAVIVTCLGVAIRAKTAAIKVVQSSASIGGRSINVVTTKMKQAEKKNADAARRGAGTTL